MALRAIRKFTDWAVGLMMVYTIISPTAQSVNWCMARNNMFYLLYYTEFILDFKNNIFSD